MYVQLVSSEHLEELYHGRNSAFTGGINERMLRLQGKQLDVAEARCWLTELLSREMKQLYARLVSVHLEQVECHCLFNYSTVTLVCI